MSTDVSTYYGAELGVDEPCGEGMCQCSCGGGCVCGCECPGDPDRNAEEAALLADPECWCGRGCVCGCACATDEDDEDDE